MGNTRLGKYPETPNVFLSRIFEICYGQLELIAKTNKQNDQKKNQLILIKRTELLSYEG